MRPYLKMHLKVFIFVNLGSITINRCLPRIFWLLKYKSENIYGDISRQQWAYFITALILNVKTFFFSGGLFNALNQFNENRKPYKPIAGGFVKYVKAVLKNEDALALSRPVVFDLAYSEFNPYALAEPIGRFAAQIAGQKERLLNLVLERT